MDLQYLAPTVAIAFTGGFLATKLRVPAGTLIGSMLAVTIMNVAVNTAYMPAGLKFYTQISTGAYIGVQITRSDLRSMKNILKPAVILATVMITVTILFGLLICRISVLSLPTALFGLAPAGIADMTLASMEFDTAEPSVVALLQTIRVVFTICFMPIMIRVIDRISGIRAVSANIPKQEIRYTEEQIKKKKTVPEIVVTMIIALICGYLGKRVGVPAGAVTCSMLSTAVFNLLTDHAYMPINLRRFVQIFSGALIGCTVGREQIMLTLSIWQVVLIALVGYTALDLIAAWLIQRHTEMDIITALFSSAPGGLTDMSLIAEDMGADSASVAGMHSLRLIGVVAIYPTIIGLLIRITA